MRKFLLFLFLLNGVLFLSKNLNAQCDLEFANVNVDIVGDGVPLGSGKCQFTFNASFDIITNSGFKYLFFHSWLLQDYPSPPIFQCNGNTPARDPGTSLELGTAVD